MDHKVTFDLDNSEVYLGTKDQCVEHMDSIQDEHQHMFYIEELREQTICVWSDLDWCFKSELKSFLNTPMAKEGDYKVVTLLFGKEPTQEQLKDTLK